MKWQSDFYPDKLLVLRSLGRCQNAGTQKLLRGIAQRITPISCTQPKRHHSQFTVALPFLSLKFVPLLLSQLLFLKMSTFDIDLILCRSPSLRNVCIQSSKFIIFIRINNFKNLWVNQIVRHTDLESQSFHSSDIRFINIIIFKSLNIFLPLTRVTKVGKILHFFDSPRHSSLSTVAPKQFESILLY